MKNNLIIYSDSAGNETINLDKTITTHLKSLRIYQKDKNINIYNGNGIVSEYFVKNNSNIAIKISEAFVEKSKNTIQIATALPKGNRLNWCIQKCTEIGIDIFHFVNFEYSVRDSIKKEKISAIIKEASSQSQRTYLPKFHLYNSLNEFIQKNISQVPNMVILDPDGNEQLDSSDVKKIPLIGPEGGFSEIEYNEFQKFQIPSKNLGQNILRIETACVYTTSILNYFCTL